MDASYKIQRGIHVHLIQFFMCPEFWVHIKRDLRFFAPCSGSARNGKQFGCGHTPKFLLAAGPQKCLLGSSPNPLDFGTNCPKVPALCAYCLRPGLTLRGLIFPPVRVAEQMINVRLDRHGLPHIRLGLAVFRIKGFFLFGELPALLFQRVHFRELCPA